MIWQSLVWAVTGRWIAAGASLAGVAVVAALLAAVIMLLVLAVLMMRSARHDG